jgi:hypothetical protein
MDDKIKTHKNLKVWQDAMKLAKAVYELTVNFPKMLLGLIRNL